MPDNLRPYGISVQWSADDGHWIAYPTTATPLRWPAIVGSGHTAADAVNGLYRAAFGLVPDAEPPVDGEPPC